MTVRREQSQIIVLFQSSIIFALNFHYIKNPIVNKAVGSRFNSVKACPSFVSQEFILTVLPLLYCITVYGLVFVDLAFRNVEQGSFGPIITLLTGIDLLPMIRQNLSQ